MVVIIDLGPAGVPFDSSAYPQGTSSVVFPSFTIYWSGEGQVFFSGDYDALTCLWSDDGWGVTITPSGQTLFSSPRFACCHEPIDITGALLPGINQLDVTVINWVGLSISYAWNGTPGGFQNPSIVQVLPDPVVELWPVAEIWNCQGSKP
jgi:hypothetical protein